MLSAWAASCLLEVEAARSAVPRPSCRNAGRYRCCPTPHGERAYGSVPRRNRADSTKAPRRCQSHVLWPILGHAPPKPRSPPVRSGRPISRVKRVLPPVFFVLFKQLRMSFELLFIPGCTTQSFYRSVAHFTLCLQFPQSLTHQVFDISCEPLIPLESAAFFIFHIHLHAHRAHFARMSSRMGDCVPRQCLCGFVGLLTRAISQGRLLTLVGNGFRSATHISAARLYRILTVLPLFSPKGHKTATY